MQIKEEENIPVYLEDWYLFDPPKQNSNDYCKLTQMNLPPLNH